MTPWSHESLSTCAVVDPYAAHPGDHDWSAPAQSGDALDYFLPPPNPADRLDYALTPHDEQRLALHSALTVAGIPDARRPCRHRPAQRSAGDVNNTLQRWLHHAHPSPSGL